MTEYEKLRKSWRAPLINEVFRIVASYSSSGSAEDYTRMEGRVLGLLTAIHVMDHQGHLPDEKLLKLIEREIWKKHKLLVNDTIEMDTINFHVFLEKDE